MGARRFRPIQISEGNMLNTHPTTRLWLLVSVGCVLLCGCGPKVPPTASVHGKVTIGGKPVTTGRITFYPENNVRPAIGAIGTDGAYRLTTFHSNDGAILGKHVVTIEAFEGSPVQGPATIEEELGGKVRGPRRQASPSCDGSFPRSMRVATVLG